MTKTIDWQGIMIEARELEAGVWIITFPESHAPSDRQIYALKRYIEDELKLSKPVLVWAHPLNIDEMSHDELKALRDTLNVYLEGGRHG